MAYNKKNWQDNVSDVTAAELNRMEQGIYDNSLVVDAVTNTLNPTDTETYKTAELTEGQITDVIGVNDIVIKGQTSQDGTPTPSAPVDVNVVSGSNVINTSNKNLLNLDFVADSDSFVGLSFSHSKSEFSLKGTATGTYKTFMLKNKINFVESNQYTLSAEITGTNPKMQVRIMAYDSSNQLIWSIAINKGNNYKNTSTFNPSAEIDHYAFIIESLENGGAYNLTAKIQLEQNSTATIYEPHQGKELPLDLPVENLMELANSTNTDSGITRVIENGVIKLNGTPQSTSYNNTILTFTATKTGQYMLLPYKSSTNSNIRFIYKINDGSFINNDDNLTMNLTKNDVVTINLRISSTDRINNFTLKPMLYLGTKANAFYPYGTDPIELCKIGDYQDYFYKSGSKWYLHKETRKKIINGSENWYYYSTGKYFYNSTILNDLPRSASSKVAISFVSNRFVYTGAVGSSSDNQMILVQQPDRNNEVDIRCDSIGDAVADFKNWLSANNISVYHSLVTPTNTEITDTTLISQLEAIYNAPLYEETNITQTNNDLPMVLDITACKDNINGIKAFIRK